MKQKRKCNKIILKEKKKHKAKERKNRSIIILEKE